MPPYLTCISLTSNTGDDHRTIDLIPGKSYIVGRASRNKDNMRAAAGNALFDCAVISREHAEIRSSPFSPGRSVTITDKKSLHGTTVNGRKLMPHSPFALKTGDVIKFGERVSRGEEAHDGISVTFHHLHQLDSHPESSYRPTSPYTRGFQVPDDSEQSDFDSDAESMASNHHDRSSAKTTPEQHKMGSQKQPIDLENVTASQQAVINLVDDEDTIFPQAPAANASQSASQSAVLDSLSAFQESILGHSGDLPVPPPSSTERKPASFYGVQESDFDDDDGDSISAQVTGLTGILNDSDTASAQQFGADEDDVDDDDDMAQYVGYSHELDDDIDSLDDSPDPSDDEGDDYDSESVKFASFNRQPSEELGEPSVPASKPDWVDEFVEKAAATSKPRYDPVRSSQPPGADLADASAAAQALPAASTYTTRWDLQPASMSQQQGDSIVHATGSPAVARGQCLDPPAFGSTAWSHMQSMQHTDMDFFSLPQNAQAFGPTDSVATVGDTTSASRKGAMAIGNLCAPQQQPSSVTESSQSKNTFGSQLSAPPTTEQAQSPTTADKRKAEVIGDDSSEEPATKKVVTVDSAGSPRLIAVPTSRRTHKHGLARQIAGAAVKHAASATVGAAATVAFLNSTYAERLIQYLS
ncbi:Putative forkhead-associated (FHA) domain, SMAD/FHA domain superfamily [Septoria linicola]|uniref:Forkhead-associated (FHA) domain, SMAD/FHA domain superfamily n=1 Tax=Septoria linicola TaxID=215465 RepID=A0A9Q9AQY5_9PEZI|nr:putative forkhead-associated (FHA) domain, SMAD/FHA domain superfamily [Septoria linicola]USW49181.1 Putative forkhead-associated (FHA) domain, SMAD/FHA domain superfamily [Septoria linicola]